MLKTISLFTGAGGLDLGLEAAGFVPALCVELDREARATLAANRPSWQLSDPGDILAADSEKFVAQAGLQRGEAALVAAGPVCQPFSHAARWAPRAVKGLGDQRAATLTACLDIIQSALPQAILLENVYGIDQGGKKSGLALIRGRLESINACEGTQYKAQALKLNSAEYGVPQVRRRMFILAHRDGSTLTPPEQTHGPRGSEFATAWDAIGDLDEQDVNGASLAPAGKWAELLPTIPEGHNYLWHTNRGEGLELFGWRTRYWSFLLKLAKQRPSWTLTASPGPATGPFHWRNRHLSVQEMCRLQTFPTGYEVAGSYSSQRRQIGNAVPCLLAEVLGKEVSRQWFNLVSSSRVAHAVRKRGVCPPPELALPVPDKYHCLVGRHPAHPGTGQGPGANGRAQKGVREDA